MKICCWYLRLVKRSKRKNIGGFGVGHGYLYTILRAPSSPYPKKWYKNTSSSGLYWGSVAQEPIVVQSAIAAVPEAPSAIASFGVAMLFLMPRHLTNHLSSETSTSAVSNFTSQ